VQDVVKPRQRAEAPTGSAVDDRAELDIEERSDVAPDPCSIRTIVPNADINDDR
jgi:hypothetical protein